MLASITTVVIVWYNVLEHRDMSVLYLVVLFLLLAILYWCKFLILSLILLGF